MKKGFVIIAVLLSVLICGNAWAADDDAIQELQNDVSSTKSKADQNKADIESLKGGLPDLERRVSDIENAGGSQGPQGEPGPSGPAGPQGPQGPAGTCECPFTSTQVESLLNLLGQQCPEGETVIGIDANGNLICSLSSLDEDGDGVISAGTGGTDCDDTNPAIYPGADELCDQQDNDCNDVIDDKDIDGDGYIDDDCTYASGDDCDDADPNINPAATEVCDGTDNDCDGQVDESCLPIVSVVINEVSANIPNGCDLIELRVIQGGSMSGFKLKERTTDIITFGEFTVETDDLIIVHFNSSDSTNCNANSASSEQASINEYPFSAYGNNFDTAWDIYTADIGMTSTDNVITIYNSLNEIEDAVLVTDDSIGDAAAGSEAQAAIVASAGEWTDLYGNIPDGGFVDNDFKANAVSGLHNTNSVDSIQRNSSVDNNHMGDWILSTSSWGALNNGQ